MVGWVQGKGKKFGLGKVDPVLALWGPFAVFAALIVWMYWQLAYVPGGQPIAGLERFAGNIAKRLRSLFARRRALLQ